MPVKYLNRTRPELYERLVMAVFSLMLRSKRNVAYLVVRRWFRWSQGLPVHQHYSGL